MRIGNTALIWNYVFLLGASAHALETLTETFDDGAGFVPNGNDRRAIFGGGIAQDAIIVVDQPVVVREIVLNNETYGYSIVGAGEVTLGHNSGGEATIDLLAGANEFQTEVPLATNVAIHSMRRS